MAGTTTAEQEDMSIISPSGSGDTTRVDQLPTVDLSFSAGAWDDRELVKAYDAAIEEFHMHHPGPGTWLDKTTALLAKGQPLPGVQAKDSAWYSSSWEGSAMDLADPEGAEKRRKTETPVKPTETVVNPYDLPVAYQANGSGPVNPYGGFAPARRKRGSPVYAPPSPPAAPQAHPIEEVQVQWEDPSSRDQSFAQNRVVHAGPSRRVARVPRRQHRPAAPAPSTSHEHGPILGVQETAGTSREQALGYAMTAQYWAGYWMGVAQSKSEEPVPPPIGEQSTQPTQQIANGQADSSSSSDSSSSEESSSEEESEDEETGVNGTRLAAPPRTNVVVTTKQFTRPGIGQALKR